MVAASTVIVATEATTGVIIVEVETGEVEWEARVETEVVESDKLVLLVAAEWEACEWEAVDTGSVTNVSLPKN